VKRGPHPDLAFAMVNDFLGVELQSLFAGTFYSNPTHPQATLPPGFDTGGELLVPDWAYVTKNRQAWIDRWEREISTGS
ncbi:MAG: ABC transporter substrate-binding protein, partial [Candidatus Rokuibacteriota bacterium]